MNEAIIARIEAAAARFTASDLAIARYFVNHWRPTDSLAAAEISETLHVSKAALTRFAQRLGYQGYREFAFDITNSEAHRSNLFHQLQTPVYETYQEILTKSEYLFSFDEIQGVVEEIRSAHKLFVYGMGSSGLIGEEFSQRLVRMGIDAECVRDAHQLSFNHVRVRPEHMVMGITYSGTTVEVTDALFEAAKKTEHTVLLVSRDDPRWSEVRHVLRLPVKERLDYSNIISPQFPVMVLLDLIYGLLLQSDTQSQENFEQATSDLIRNVRERKETE